MQQLGVSIDMQSTTSSGDAGLIVDLNKPASLAETFEAYKRRVRPKDDEDIHETILNAISRDTGIAVEQLAYAYHELLNQEMGEREAWMLLRMIEGINEHKLANFITEYNAIAARTPERKPEEIVFAIGFAKEDKYWRDPEEPNRIFKFAARYNLITVIQES